jgi:hypothetical protein
MRLIVLQKITARVRSDDDEGEMFRFLPAGQNSGDLQPFSLKSEIPGVFMQPVPRVGLHPVGSMAG